jgi:antirestriction protein ArdC
MTQSISTNPRADFYQRITDTIIRDLEQGARPWTKPWTTTSSASSVIRPLRHDGTPYRGINILILWSEASDHGYTSSTWMTYRQAQSLGAQVRKGERGTTIVYAKPIQLHNEDATTDEDNTRTVPLLRAYTVFNVDQIDGLSIQYMPNPVPGAVAIDVSGRVDRADAFVTATGAHIQHRGNRACYVPSLDRIEMPAYRQFQDTPASTAAEGYYATLLHELIHWTSPAHRCARDLGKRFADHAYAREELVAEIGAAFLCADLNITLEPRPDHAAYIATWLTVLKSDKRAIFNAAALAQRAVDWLHHGVRETSDETTI